MERRRQPIIKKIKKVNIRGEPWRVHWPTQIRNGSCYGLCDLEHRGILLEASLKDKKLVEILIHEMLHAEFQKAAERVVTQAARDITDALWRTGCLR